MWYVYSMNMKSGRQDCVNRTFDTMADMFGNEYWEHSLTSYMDKSRDIYGHRVKKTTWEYPYSYDPFVVYKSFSWREDDQAVYSDRLSQWNGLKYRECVQAVWGDERQRFSQCRPSDIQRFLNLYMGKEIELTGIEEGCNVASGYPYWVFYFRDAVRISK